MTILFVYFLISFVLTVLYLLSTKKTIKPTMGLLLFMLSPILFVYGFVACIHDESINKKKNTEEK